MRLIARLMFPTVILFVSYAHAGDTNILKTEYDKASYSMGVSMARNLKQTSIGINPDLVVKGMEDEFSGGKLLVSEDDLRKTMMGIQNELRLKQKENRKKGE